MNEDKFDALEEAVREGGPQGALARLVETLRAEENLAQLFEALLMQKRYELGLPMQGADSLKDIPEEAQQTLEDCYVEACRTVGSLFLERGDIVGAWPYFQAIEEPEEVAEALERWSPPDDSGDADEHTVRNDTDSIVKVAFEQGAHPRRGFEIILSELGICQAISVFEHQFPYSREIKEHCAAKLVRQLYRELEERIRSDVEAREGEPPKETDVRSLIQNRKWLFEGQGCHVDVSHLQAVVRAASIVRDHEEIDLAVQLCEYGRNLARDYCGAATAPFEDYYNDCRILLRALLGEGSDGAVRYFAIKAQRAVPDEDGGHFAGEVSVHLLHRLGRHREAVEAYLHHLKGAPHPLNLAPSLSELCEFTREYESLLDFSREKGDLLQFTAALVRKSETEAETEPRD